MIQLLKFTSGKLEELVNFPVHHSPNYVYNLHEVIGTQHMHHVYSIMLKNLFCPIFPPIFTPVYNGFYPSE